MGKARAQQFSQTRTLHRRRRPRGARDRTRLRRRHAVLSHRRRTALPPPRQTPQTRRFSPSTQQQQLWQHLFASLVRAVWPRRSLAGARLARTRRRAGLIAAEADDRDGLGRAPAKEPATAGAIGEAAALAPAADATAACLPAACAQQVYSHLTRSSTSRQRPDSVQTASRQCPDSVQTASRQQNRSV